MNNVPLTVIRALEILHQEGCSFGGVPTASMIIEVIEKAGGQITDAKVTAQEVNAVTPPS